MPGRSHPTTRVCTSALACVAIACVVLLMRAALAQAAGHDVTIGTAATSGVSQVTVDTTTTFTAIADDAQLNASNIASGFLVSGVTKVIVDTGSSGGDAGVLDVMAALSVPAGKTLVLQSSATAGSLLVDATLDGPGSLELRAASVDVSALIGGSASPSSIVISGAPATPTVGITTIGAYLYGESVEVRSRAVFPGTVAVRARNGDLAFDGAVDGPGHVDARAAGSVRFGGTVGGNVAPSDMYVKSDSTIELLAGAATMVVAGSIDLQSPVTFAAVSQSLTSTQGKVYLRSSIDGVNALSISTHAGADFGGEVGATQHPSSIVVVGASELEVPSVTTVGDQSWNGAVTIDASATFTSANGAIAFASRIDAGDSGCALAVDAATTATFTAGIASSTAVDTLDVDAASIVLGGGVRSQGNQHFGGPITLTGAANLVASGDGAITLDGAIGGAYAFGTSTTATTSLGGSIGSPSTDPTSVTFSGSGAVVGTGASITATGAITTNGPVLGTTALRSTAGALLAAGDVTPKADGVLDVAQASSINGALGGSTATKAGAGTLRLLGTDTSSGPITVSSGVLQADGNHSTAVVLEAGTSLRGSGTLGAVTATDARIEPGAAAGPLAATLTVASLAASGASSVTLHVTPAGAQGQLHVIGALDLGAATTLDVDLQHVVAVGTALRLVDHDDGTPVVGTFVGHPPGSTFHDVPTDTWYRIDYDGGDGNDVVVTRVALDTTTTASATPAPATFGAPVTLHASVAAAGSPPTGTVTFGDGGHTLCTATLIAGSGSCTNSGLAVGRHAIDATYSGDVDHHPSSAASFDQVVDRGTATIALTATPGSATVGTAVTFTADVTAPAGAVPAGTVTFSDATSDIGAAPLSGGRAAVTTISLAVGAHDIAVRWNGDADRAPAAAHLELDVTQIATATRLLATPSVATAGEAVTLFATVAGDGATGAVTFVDGATPIAAVPLVGGGAVATTSALAPGDHVLRADYAGDAAHAASTSTPVTLHVDAAPPRSDTAPPRTMIDEVPPRVLIALPRHTRLSRGGSLVVRVTCPRHEERCNYVGLLSSSLRHHTVHGRARVDRNLVAAQVVTVRGGQTSLLKLHLTFAAQQAVAVRPVRAVLRLVLSDAAGNVTRAKRIVVMRHH